MTKLGQGGMDEVYRADDLVLDPPVALKFLPEGGDVIGARLDQLRTEVRLARQISHPNICAVYDIGESENTPFISMEFIEGEDLQALLTRVGRPVRYVNGARASWKTRTMADRVNGRGGSRGLVLWKGAANVEKRRAEQSPLSPG